MTLEQTFKQEAEQLAPQLVAWRRDFHAHPELGFEEVRTAGIVAEHLNDLGLEVSTDVGKTGVVAMIEGDDLPDDAPTVMLRFDMDALPITEINDLPYRSRNDGVMHACGHDGHTAIGMGVAQLLNAHRSELNGRIKLVFQPAEEGLGGARAMIADGVLEGPTPAASFGLHLWSKLPLNHVVVQPGPLWATSGVFRATVHGKGGHGAQPHETIDATLIGAQIVVAWQSIIARNVDPARSAVISVGKFVSGTTTNVISAEAELSGTYRAFSDETETLILTRMESMATNIAAAYGATCEFNHRRLTPVTVNSEAGAAMMQDVAEEIVGAERVIQIKPMMVGEDMSEFLNRAPGCFILVGASNPAEGIDSPHHSPTFNFDEEMLPTGVALLAGAATTYIERHQKNAQ